MTTSSRRSSIRGQGQRAQEEGQEDGLSDREEGTN